jgi:hypothetical protein
MKKSIIIQTQNIEGRNISPLKPVSFCSLTVDNIKITIDAYNGSAYSGEPREDSLLTVVDEKEVFELTPERLMKIIRFYAQYAYENKGQEIVRYKNSYHYITPDALKWKGKG